MTIYLDVIWALNFLFDSFLLYLTAAILKRNCKIWRVFLGGFIGSSIILLSVSPFYSYSSHPLAKFIFSVAMIIAVFGYKRWRYFFNGLMTFYMTTFLAGGALIGAHYFIQFDFDLSSSVMLASVKGFGDPISWLFVFIGFPIAWHFSKRNFDSIEVVKLHFEQLVNVKITILGREIFLRGLIDSGNQLYDPISKLPVMFVSLKKADERVPDIVLEIAENPEEVIFGKKEMPPKLEKIMRIIPYRVVGQEHQLIIGIKAENIEIEKNGDCWQTKNGLVSFTMQQLSADGSFQCIVHPKLLSGTMKNTPYKNVSQY
ncbi:sigma-E processing peptidase SpoIIGA [Bacillus methanolicus PB1]|uniref:Sigma-E processing peptidase SpoIIGA n=1 Tax=Bacillus methanolicus PB1 TaxID=997296 RepID=I3E512_BACMT|nr:sigma-E processing peptidase SpoIIGA [Bacillus methanolicus]EIJ81583.1 sigma-E processing peptidase SpoIIGA [Bacillus methanolicus PB1]